MVNTKGSVIVVYGPKGCGKTVNKIRLAIYFKAGQIFDGMQVSKRGRPTQYFGQSVDLAKKGQTVLVLTNQDFSGVTGRDIVRNYIGFAIPVEFVAFDYAMGCLDSVEENRLQAEEDHPPATADEISKKIDEALHVISQAWGRQVNSAAIMAGNLERLAHHIHKQNVKVGWWDELEGMNDRQRRMLFAEKLALVHSEVSEALEGLRKDQMDDHLPWRKMVEVEISDAIIRLLDLAKGMDLEVGAPLIEKLAYNATRADHKRENRNAAGGKAF